MTATSISSDKKRPWRWWRLQFGLRSLLGLMLAACLLMGGWRWYHHSYVRQFAATQELARLDVRVFAEPGRPAWVRRFFKEDVFRDVVRVAMDGHRGLSDSNVAPLAHLPRLRQLSLDGTTITDAGLAHLAGLTHLEVVTLNQTRITNAGLAKLRGLRSLRRLDLNDTMVDGSGLAHLAGLKKLETLNLNRLPIQDEHLSSLANLKELTALSLDGTQIRGPGLQSLQRLPKLARLDLKLEQPVEHINLRGFTAIKSLSFQGPWHGHARLVIHDCPQLARLKIDEKFNVVDLRNLPRLTSFSNLGTVTKYWRQRLRGTTDPDKDQDYRCITVRLCDVPDLAELELESYDRLALDLQRAPALRKLTLSALALKSVHLVDVPGLEELHLVAFRRGNLDAFPVEHCGQLRKLTLETDEATGWRLSRLGDLPQLETLHVAGGSINGAELDGLTRDGRLKSLRSVVVASNSFPSEALRKLSLALPPDCRVRRDLRFDGYPREVFAGGELIEQDAGEPLDEE